MLRRTPDEARRQCVAWMSNEKREHITVKLALATHFGTYWCALRRRMPLISPTHLEVLSLVIDLLNLVGVKGKASLLIQDYRARRPGRLPQSDQSVLGPCPIDDMHSLVNDIHEFVSFGIAFVMRHDCLVSKCVSAALGVTGDDVPGRPSAGEMILAMSVEDFLNICTALRTKDDICRAST